MRLRSSARLLVLMVAVALTTAGCGAPSNLGAISGYVVRFSGTRSVEASAAGALSVVPTLIGGLVPVAGATVYYQGPSDAGFVTSGSSGRFQIKNLAPGTYTLSVSHQSYVGTYTITGTVYSGQTSFVGEVSAGTVRLLSIGINDYTDVGRLTGPVKDAEMLYSSLGVGATQAGDAWLLTDSQATKAGIQEAIWRITEGMDSNDTFVMVYAGHGTKNDLNTHEYIVPYDYVKDVVSTLISDTELNEWLDSSLAGNRGVFILDSCNSGGMASAAAFVPRGMKLSTSFETMARNVSGDNRVVMTAATKYQDSYESSGLWMPGGSQETHGHFAYSFARGMWYGIGLPDTQSYPADSNPRDGLVSCREAFDHAKAFIDYYVGLGTWPVQTPQIFDPGNIASSTYIFSY